jgi:uncharacterized membrane protein YheB (UPF0754 family)
MEFFNQLSVNILKLSWIPFITALIGWGTNWVAIRMLFQPKSPYTFVGIKIQGLIPKRQKELATKTADVVEKEILNQHTIRQNILKLDLEPYLEDFAQKLIQNRLGERLRSIPMLGSFISDATLDKLQIMALEELRKEARPLQAAIANEVEGHLQVKELIEARIASFDPEKLEAVVQHVAHKELKTIEWLGALLGFIVGLGQIAVLLLL